MAVIIASGFFGLLFGLFIKLPFDLNIRMQSSWFRILYWLIAFAWSGFLAAFVFHMHDFTDKTNQYTVTKEEFVGAEPTNNVKKVSSNSYTTNPRQYGYSWLDWAGGIHQFAFNFFGAIIGWFILYFFICGNFSGYEGWEKFLLAGIAFLSITGYLPFILIKQGMPWTNSKN